MHRNYFIPTPAEGNSVLQLVKKDVEHASKALKTYMGLNSFHVTAMDEYEWVVSLERPPCISLYAEALRTEPLVLRFQFSSEYPAKAPLVRVVKGVPHPMFFGLKLEMKCAESWVAGKSTLTQLLRAVWWASAVPLAGMHVPNSPLCQEMALRYCDTSDREMRGYVTSLLVGADQWQAIGSKQKVSVSLEALADIKPSLEFIRQIQLVEVKRRKALLGEQRRQRHFEGEALMLAFRDASTGKPITGIGPVGSAVTPDDIRDEVRAALRLGEANDVTFTVNDSVIARHASFGSALEKDCPFAVITVAVITPCSCCISDVDFFRHLELMYLIKDICSQPWSVDFHEQYRHSLPETFVAAVAVLLHAHEADASSRFAMLPPELLVHIIQAVWHQYVPPRLRQFLVSDFCTS